MANVTSPPATPDSLPPLYGLVLAGGHSSRMGRDKAGIDYHGTSQVDHAVRLLQEVTQHVFVSLRAEQGEEDLYAAYEQIPDGQDVGKGPVAGLLSAMRAHPDAAWLVLACDMPHVEAGELFALTEGRDSDHLAVAFQGTSGSPEPLCTIYEPGMADRLTDRVAQGRYSLRDALDGPVVKLLQPECPKHLVGSNTKEESARARGVIAARAKK